MLRRLNSIGHCLENFPCKARSQFEMLKKLKLCFCFQLFKELCVNINAKLSGLLWKVSTRIFKITCFVFAQIGLITNNPIVHHNVRITVTLGLPLNKSCFTTTWRGSPFDHYLSISFQHKPKGIKVFSVLAFWYRHNGNDAMTESKSHHTHIQNANTARLHAGVYFYLLSVTHITHITQR